MPFVRTDFRQCPLFKLENFEPCILFCTRQPFKKGTRRFRVHFRFQNRVLYAYKPHPQPSLRCLPSDVLPLPQQQPQEAELSLFVSDIAG